MRSSESAPPRSMSRGLRIVGGVHRGRRLAAPAGETVRPTSDRAREALFNILSHGSFAAGGLPFAGRPVLDAFAGTGALGLEALSRGASAAVFIENGRDALATLRRNIAALGEEDRAHIVAADATRPARAAMVDRKSTRLNSSHMSISYAVFCLKKKKKPLYPLYYENTKSTTHAQ